MYHCKELNHFIRFFLPVTSLPVVVKKDSVRVDNMHSETARSSTAEVSRSTRAEGGAAGENGQYGVRVDNMVYVSTIWDVLHTFKSGHLDCFCVVNIHFFL